MPKYYLSFCLIVRDDQAYIREWVDYHRSIGVDHFYITDNKSQPPLRETLKDYIASGLVTYKYDTRDHPQVAVYNECIQQHKNDSTWIAFFDVDEFLVLKKHSSLKNFLKDYEAFGALSVVWYLFGSNGHLRKQASIRQSYTTRVDNYDNHFKTIVQPKRVLRFIVHNVASHVLPYYTVDEKKRRVSAYAPIQHGTSTELCQLNHYVLRSHDDYLDKQRRGGGANAPHKVGRSWDFFFNINFRCIIEDRQILQRGTPCRRLESPPPIPHDPPDFNWVAYLINHPDISAVECSQKYALIHWYNYGRKEKRSYQSTTTFNWKNYVNRYHLTSITTEEAALRHYLLVGRKNNHNSA
jgi:hypothetical protein